MPKKSPAKVSALVSFRRTHPIMASLMLSGILVGFVAIAVMGKFLWYLNNNLNERTNVNTLSALIIRAAASLKVDAPIDTRTGDIYFPQAKLYLPAPAAPTRLSYEYNPYGADGPTLSVSSVPLFTSKASRLYTAKDTHELFDYVPLMQACQRGITVAYKPLQGAEAREATQVQIILSNGKTLYLSRENACPELGPTIDLLKTLRPY